MLIVNDKISIPIKEFRFSFSRSPGPGGQNVNKVNTKVTLRWAVRDSSTLADDVKQRFIKAQTKRIAQSGDWIINSHRFRDQGRNVADCLNKLRELILLVAEPPKIRKITKPSKGSVRRRVESKKRQSEKKQSRRSHRLDD